MGRGVIISYRIMPSDPSVDVGSIEDKIRKIDDVELKDIKIEPIAFGLKAITAAFLVPDESGVADKLEEKLRSIEGVGEVETLGVTLI
jgi:elongation factor 1-beta